MTRPARSMLGRLVAMVLAAATVGLVPIVIPSAAHAAAGDIGYEDFTYGPPETAGSDGFLDPNLAPTASKPQSKLWFAQGIWWGVLQVPNTHTTAIHRYDMGNHDWVDTGVVIDGRDDPTHADVLWDGSKLFVASAGRDRSPFGIVVSRFRYDGSAKKYVVDAGFPTAPLTSQGVEAAVIAKDGTGRLWVAYTSNNAIGGRDVRVLASDTSQSSFPDKFTPSVAGIPLDGTSVAKDDIATIIAHDGEVSLVWSNQNADVDGNTGFYVARHPDGAAPQDGWTGSQKLFSGPKVADDHISLTSVEGRSNGNVYAMVKSSADDVSPRTPSEALVWLLVIRPDGTWQKFLHSTVKEGMSRPIVMLEPSKNLLHVFSTRPVEGGVIYHKTSSLDDLGFGAGKGEAFIKLANHPMINNATSSKQNVTDASGIMVLASDQTTGNYAHNHLPRQAPTAGFSWTPQSGPAPLDVQFTDTSTGSVDSWSWDFGDGTTSTLRNPTHTFQKQGTFPVTLTARNVAGVTTRTLTIKVNIAKPVASFTYTPRTGPAPLTMQFTDTSATTGGAPASWLWDFGDGTTSTQQNPSHVFAKKGSYTVRLTATNLSGSHTAQQTIGVAVTKPVADFTWTPESGAAPLTVQFTDISATKGDAPTAWQWDFGDGTTSTQQNPSHVFEKESTYTVGLTATNVSGAGSVQHVLQIAVRKPVASFTNQPGSGFAPLAVAFTDTSSGPPASWSWTFGDGATSTEQNPTHTYSVGGSYEVSLTVVNPSGSSTVRKAITIAPHPQLPVVVLDAPVVTTTSPPALQTTWHTSTAAGEVVGYEVEVREIGASRRAQWTSQSMTTTETNLQVLARPGSTYCLRVRAGNLARETGEWSAAGCTAVPLDDRDLARRGKWRAVSGDDYYLGTALVSRTRGASLSRSITGNHVSLLVTKQVNGGRVLVYRGDRLVKRVSLKASRKASTARSMKSVEIASSDKVTTARYTVVVVSRGRPVTIDGLVVSRR